MPLGAIFRRTLGLVAARSVAPVAGISTAFDAGEWTGLPLATQPPTVVAGRLRFENVPTTQRTLRWLTPGALTNALLYINFSGRNLSNFVGAALRVSSTYTAGQPDRQVQSVFGTGLNIPREFIERNAGANRQNEIGPSADLAMPERHLISVEDAVGVAKWPDQASPQLLLPLPLLALSAGWVGFRICTFSGGAWVEIDNIAVMSSRYLRLTSAPAGSYVEVLTGGVVVGTAAEAGGVISVDLWAVNQWPGPDTIRLRAADTTIIDSDSPSNLVWAGDSWEFVELPAVPSAPVVGTIDAREIPLSWASVSGATSYRLYRATSQAGVYTLITTQAGLSYTDEPPAFNTTYWYRLTASNEAGESAPSASVSATTERQYLTPGPWEVETLGLPDTGTTNQIYATIREVLLAYVRADDGAQISDVVGDRIKIRALSAPPEFPYITLLLDRTTTPGSNSYRETWRLEVQIIGKPAAQLSAVEWVADLVDLALLRITLATPAGLIYCSTRQRATLPQFTDPAEMGVVGVRLTFDLLAWPRALSRRLTP
jgi:hypothetical protein